MMDAEHMHAAPLPPTRGQRGRLIGIGHLIAAFVWLAATWLPIANQGALVIDRYPAAALHIESYQFALVFLSIALIFFVSGARILRARRTEGVTYGSR